MDARKRRATKPTSPDSQPHQHSSSSSSSSTTIRSKTDQSSSTSEESEMEALPRSSSSWRQHWMFFAVASGACAAFNGVFAKLTTTELTSNLSTAIAKSLSISHSSILEIIFFILNLTFNGINQMWSLFTTALAKGTSATQVSIMNTSTNFLVTAFTGLVIFSEALPPMWWAGASLLVAGSVIAGRKDEGEDGDGDAAAGDRAVPVSVPVGGGGGGGGVLELDEDLDAGERYRDEDVPDLGELRS
ncbi:hypothetical protein CCMA1212_009038 [Trichoderma ghanense]|uniref:Transmembrane protein 42 n=1 Tax=Trichoderma ghanense TaxID=65468 RepID=A0ABY2GVE2_9HYPO